MARSTKQTTAPENDEQNQTAQQTPPEQTTKSSRKQKDKKETQQAQPVQPAPASVPETKRSKKQRDVTVPTAVVAETEQPAQQTTQITTTNSGETRRQTFEELMVSYKTQMNTAREQFRQLKHLVTRMEIVHNQEVKRLQTKKHRRQSSNKHTGFTKTKPVPAALAEYIGVNVGEELSTPQIAKSVWGQLKKRGLISKENGRVFVPDKITKKVFSISNEEAKFTELSKDHGFNMYTLQSYIKRALTV